MAEINREDFKIDVDFEVSGKRKKEAVRITHIPSGASECWYLNGSQKENLHIAYIYVLDSGKFRNWLMNELGV